MATFRSCYHDFPRLAKQSGYFFQLYRGRVNWSEIENLNIDEIIDNKNFQTLEKNLINVINCNLEREYDLKVLDRNFVKLFKLAQLGVDYLSYCEQYLDRCVVLLQEQLIALQEEYELLKQENAKRSEELRKSKKKSRIQSYQCEKCDKVFISEVYLKCHEKRRHCSPKTCKTSEESPKTFTDKCQQTEIEEKQPLDCARGTTPIAKPENEAKEAKEKDEMEMIKKENKIKIENLEKELEEVKSRLKKAESALTTKCEVPISSAPQSLSFPSPGPGPNTVFYPPMLQWIPSYLPQPQVNYFNYTQGYESLVLENESRENCNFSNFGDSRTVDSKNFSDDEPSLNSGSKDNLRGKEGELTTDSLSEFRKNSFVRTRYREKENVDPTEEEKVSVDSEKPRLVPRKIKSFPRTNLEKESSLEEFRRDVITQSSTPVKEKHETEVKETISDELEEDSGGSSSNRGIVSSERKPKSFFKKFLVKKSPKLQELSKNLKTSLTNLYDSVSYGGKEARKTKESRGTVVDGLHGELRKLGVDPDWSGIPKNTVHQKLKILKHRRKLMTRENPLYPVVRKGIEKNVLKRLDNYANLNRKKDVVKRESNEQESIVVKNLGTGYKTPGAETESETESKSDFENSEAPREVIREQTMSWQKEDVSSNGDSTGGKDFDFSVFQVSKERDSKQSTTRGGLFGVIEDLEIVSDLDSQKSDDADDPVLEEKTRDGEENEKENRWKGKHENASKSTTLRSLSKPQGAGLKKKVVFRDLSQNQDQETTEIGFKPSSTKQSIGGEDTWALKSRWESCDRTVGDVG